MLRYVCFDLDGTLLDLDMQGFMKAYIGLVSREFAPWVQPDRFARQLLASTDVMADTKDPDRTTLQTFADDFFSKLGLSPELMAIFQRFYANDFRLLKDHGRPLPDVAPLLEAIVERGHQLVLATNPVFPEVAIRERMRWAGVETFPWVLITTCENMHYAKPHVEYYQEILEHIGASGSECLMVGNDPIRDLPASSEGMRTFLVRRPRQDGDDDPLTYWPTMRHGEQGERLVPHYVGTLGDLRQMIERGELG